MFYAFSIQKGKRKNHYYRYKQRKLSLLRSRINVLSTKQILRGIQNWTTNGFLKIPPSTDSRGKKRKSILDFKGSLKILSKITQCNGKNHKAHQRCLHFRVATGCSSGRVYVLLRVFKYLMKDNPCPNTSLLLVMAKMRMKEKAIRCYQEFPDLSKTEAQPAV